MKSVLLNAPRSLSVEEVEEPNRPGDGEVLVQVQRVTLCGSDIHYFLHGSHSTKVQFPIVLGHEASGVVIATGDNVTSVKPGDRVAIEPGIWCGRCVYCARNQYQFCEKMQFMASKGYPGALRERVVWPESAVWKLPDRMSLDEGALLEPLSVAYAAMEGTDFGQASSALVLGAGSIGLLACGLIRQLHPHVECFVLDNRKERFDLARRQGIDTGRAIVSGDADAEFPAADIVIDTTGHPGVIESAFRSMNKGGRILLIGLSRQPLGLDVMDLVYKGVTIKGSYRYSHTYPKLLELSDVHSFGTSSLITHRFGLGQAQEAFETASAAQKSLKVVIEL
ncbi:zinc-dependent alcohol dehydrogenase [Cohnella terricola]|uniref:Zinc-binding dehydrogenase n=1 Tax=Cohnella terricola TaxID=1289167 RepID=A0A559JT34_9BACL|nr:alcohol dehydrogenase catalytic domain-containing protein [Cohnella terricola]TVY03042.1 zinc-binding dehydrogenase [Cohnella terricola]